MESLKQFFSYMNDINFPYVVLRNFDNLPYDVVLGEHSDLDLLVYDYEHFREVFPSAVPCYPYPRVRMRIPIGESYVYLDVRHVGDDYYPEEFERAILENREFNSRGFFTPNGMMHAIALSYHAVHHKGSIAKEYRRFLGDASVGDLLVALQASNVGWVPPQDSTVGKYYGYWKGATSVVERKDGLIVKKQVSYLDYPLLKNEFDILSRMPARHFPLVHRLTDEGEMWIEDCGVPLTHKNVPADWRAQLEDIMHALNLHQVQHRDVKLDNLMLKDGVIRLIDFGWAVTIPPRGGIFEKLESEPPTCLGFPNKSSDGFSDAYSMRRVVKQLDYELEEMEEKRALERAQKEKDKLCEFSE